MQRTVQTKMNTQHFRHAFTNVISYPLVLYRVCFTNLLILVDIFYLFVDLHNAVMN